MKNVNPKFLLIGGSGMIGYNFLKIMINNKINFEYTYNKNPIPYDKKGYFLDITDKKGTIDFIAQINPNYIIHTAAISNADFCETNTNYADLVNVTGTENVVEACKKTASKIIFISSSYVFDGKKDEYFENDPTSPTTYYGVTKEKSEKLIQNSDIDFLILRTDQPYCWTEKWQRSNSVMRVIQSLKSSNIFKEIIDWYSNPTYVPNFVDITLELIKTNSSGIYHLTGPDFICRYEWSLLVCEIFNLNKKLLIPIKSNELNLSVKRKKIKMNSQKIFKELGINTMGIHEGLETMFKTKNTK